MRIQYSMLVALLAFSGLPSAAQAQDRYPMKSVRIIVPFAPGGSTDIIARLIAERLTASLGQSVLVENRPGAAGGLGADAVAKAAPDGHTLLMATTGVMAINQFLYKSMAYDPERELVPAVFVASITNVLAVPADLPVRTVAELVALARKDAGKLSFASSGAGSSTHLSAELFKSLTNTDILHVPYKGSGQALADVVTGRVSMIFDNMPSALPHIKAGKLRALAVTGSKRSAALAEIPTVAEAGVVGYESLSWSGLAVPIGTPRETIARLNREVIAILAASEMRQKFADQGADAVGGTPQAFDDHIKTERLKWGKLVRDRSITVN